LYSNCNVYNIFSRFVVKISAQVAPWCDDRSAMQPRRCSDAPMTMPRRGWA